MLDGLSFFGKNPKPKGFAFKPRYYNETKDEIETRLNQRRAQREVPPVHGNGSGRGGIRFRNDTPREINSGSNIRLLFILLALLGAGYWLIQLNF